MIIIAADHAAWLEERKFGCGASDAASILGISKWKTNQELWEEKTGLRQPEDISDKPYVQYGHDAEPHIRALFSLDHPEYDVRYDSAYKIIRNDDHPFIFATPDGELTERETGRHGGLEIKTTTIQNAGQWKNWDGKIPDQYYCQVVWQMIATGWEFVWLRAQIKYTTRTGEDRSEMRDYYIDRNDVLDDIEYTMAAGIEFWRQVETKQRPALILPEI